MTDPDDDTQPHATGASDPARPVVPPPPPAPDAPPPAAPDAPAGPAATPPPPPGPSLRVNPDAPRDSGWREPPWIPPDDRRHRRDRDRRPNGFAVLVGFALIAIGGWYFLDRTLGVSLPRIEWRSLWPVILIVLGGWILIQSMQRRS